MRRSGLNALFDDDDDDDDDGDDGASVVLVVRQSGFLNALVNVPASSSAVARVTWTHSAQNTRTHLISACSLRVCRVYRWFVVILNAFGSE